MTSAPLSVNRRLDHPLIALDVNLELLHQAGHDIYMNKVTIEWKGGREMEVRAKKERSKHAGRDFTPHTTHHDRVLFSLLFVFPLSCFALLNSFLLYTS